MSNWSADPKFRPFWRHYRACQKWMDEHRRVLDRLQKSTIPGDSPAEMNSCRPPFSFDNFSPMTVEVDGPSERVISEGEQVEMSTEMIAFFRKTMEHRLERDRKRIFSLNNEDDKICRSDWLIETAEYISADQVGVDGLPKMAFSTPSENMTIQKRKEQAELLYGKDDFEKLMAMETIMQMRFDMEIDKSRPPLWPNIPLKL